MSDQPAGPGFATLALHAGWPNAGSPNTGWPGPACPAHLPASGAAPMAEAYRDTPSANVPSATAVLEERMAVLEGGAAASAVGMVTPTPCRSRCM